MNQESIESLSQLEGKTIAKIRCHGINSMSVETTEGRFYMVNTVCILPSVRLYGLEAEEVTRGEILETE